MERVTFFESIIKILKTISSIPLFIEILILTFFLLIIMIFFYFRNSKKGRLVSLIIYCVTLFLLPLTHFSFFAQTIDKIIENYIKILYFPSCYVYIIILLISDISLLRNIAKDIKNDNKNWYMVIELIYFSVFQFLFFMIIRLVIANNVDIFERTEVYSISALTSCVQISSYLFWIRVGIILIIKIINKLSGFELGQSNSVTAREQEIKISVPIKKDKKKDKKLNPVNEKSEYSEESNDLLKRLLGQEYSDYSNDTNDTNVFNNRDNAINNNDNNNYFYDDFFDK